MTPIKYDTAVTRAYHPADRRSKQVAIVARR